MAACTGLPSHEECQFFYKVGACRHGAKCVRRHTAPDSSPALMIVGLPIPAYNGPDLEAFVESLFVEVALLAPVHEMFVAANDSPHLKGNVYFSFASSSDAASVVASLNSRWFAERPIYAQLLPSRSLALAVCREGSACQRQLNCNYAHQIELPPHFWARLFAAQEKEYAASPPQIEAA